MLKDECIVPYAKDPQMNSILKAVTWHKLKRLSGDIPILAKMEEIA